MGFNRPFIFEVKEKLENFDLEKIFVLDKSQGKVFLFGEN